MGDRRDGQVERMARYAHLIEKQAGKAVRPFRADGYVNMLNKYGTQKDPTERYQYQADPAIPDEMLTMYYEGNGLFAKIIDTPAEEAIKHGFKLEGLKDQKVEDFFSEALDELDWEETAMTAIRWARLFGGSIAVMLINDGRGLEEPLDWRNIRSIDDIRVYDRSVIQPEEQSMFSYDPQDPFRTRGSRLGMPERYHVNSRYGSFTVHDSRCLVFQNGILPENATSSIYRLWGIPEYVRIQRAIRDAEIAHGSATKLLDRSVQAVYKMKDLAAELATDEGEDRVLRRLQTIDMARGLLNSITIDSEGEDYDFRQFQFGGVSDVIDSTCNFLSALTSIPQTILFGRSPAGMNSTGDADLENWYNALERIQNRMVKKNLRYLLSVVFQAGVRTGEVDEVPKIKIAFNPLWSLSDMEQADLEQKRAQTQLTKAQTAQTYIDKQVIDPSEVRKKLADSEEFDVESMLDELDDEDLFAEMADEQPDENPAGIGQSAVTNAMGHIPEQGDFSKYAQGVSVEEHKDNPQNGGNAPEAAPAATKLPQDMSREEKQKASRAPQTDASDDPTSNTTDDQNASSVGVLVISDGRILTGTRRNAFGYGLICGPGGHIEPGETPTQTAFRETEEEFGISPKSLIPLGFGPKEPDTGLTPYLFLCTDYEGEPDCVDMEMAGATFRTMEELDELAASVFQPFADGLEILKACIETALFYGDDGGEMYNELVDSIGRAVNDDGGPGSGNFGHEGRQGQIGGSLGEVGELAQKSASPQEYICKNAKTLMQHGIKTRKDATKAWKDGNYAKDIQPHEISVEEAVGTIREKVPDNVLTGWFRDADSTYKGRLEELALADDSVRNAGLNIAYQNYCSYAGSEAVGFDQFLDREITVYRGKNSGNWVEGDDVVSFSFDRKAAEKFGANVTEIKIKPSQTIGSYQTTGECEILVRRCDIDAPGFQGDSAEAMGTGNPRIEEISRIKAQFAENGNGGSKTQTERGAGHNSVSEDGGPGSGNHGHEGVPGQVGGSAPSAGTLNKSIEDSYKTGNFSDVGKAVRKCLKDAPVGSKVTIKGTAYTKKEDDKYEYEWKPGQTTVVNENYVANQVDPFDPEKAPKFEEIKAEDIAEAKVATGELSPEATSVAIPAKEYAGKTDFPEGSVPQEVMNQKKKELTRNLTEHGEEGEMSDQEVERLVGAVKHYNLGGQCQEILSAQDPETYRFIRSTMSDDRKTWASEQADAIERFIELSDKIKAPVYRGMSFNDVYDDSGGAAMRFVESLEQGKTIDFGHISSWASSRGTAVSYSNGALDADLEDGTNYSILMTVRNPKSTVSLGGINPESECLSPKSAKYVVAQVNKTYDEDVACYYYDVELEEV